MVKLILKIANILKGLLSFRNFHHSLSVFGFDLQYRDLLLILQRRDQMFELGVKKKNHVDLN